MKPVNRELPPTPDCQVDKETSLLKQGYTKLSEVEEIDGNPYEALVHQEETKDSTEDTNQILQAIEESQAKLSQDMKLSFQTILSEIHKLQESVENVKSINIDLQRYLLASTSKTTEKVESLKRQFLETSDHLKENISKIGNSTFRRQSSAQFSAHVEKSEAKTRHSFNWDIQRVDNLVKSQGQVSSQSYLIGNINYKVLGGVNFMKDGSLSVYLSGESIRPQDSDQMTAPGRFNCTVSVTDRSGNLMDWIVGKISGNFFKAKMWIVGSVHINDLKKKGYLMQGKHIKLLFIIDLVS